MGKIVETNLGSLRCIRQTGNDNMIREYEGLSKDENKLPNYVRTGSSCYMVDTGDLYIFEKTTNTWYKQ